MELMQLVKYFKQLYNLYYKKIKFLVPMEVIIWILIM